MNDSLQRAQARLAASAATTRAFYSRHRFIVLGGLTILCLLLIVWARLGFTLQFGQSYAGLIAPGLPCMRDGDCMSGNCKNPLPLTPGVCTLGNLPNGAVCTGDSVCKSNSCKKPPGPPSPLGVCVDKSENPVDCALTGTTCDGTFIFSHYSNCVGKRGTNCAATGNACQSDNNVNSDSAKCVSVATVAPTVEPTTPSNNNNNNNNNTNTNTSNTTTATTTTTTATTTTTRPPAAVLTATCTSGKLPVVLRWNNVANKTQNVLVRRTNLTNAVNVIDQPAAGTTVTYSDSQLTAGVTYTYNHKTDPNVLSNTITATVDAGGNCTIVGAVTPTPTPTTSLTPTPTPSQSTLPVIIPVACAPATQTVGVGQVASFTASGGSTTAYTWSALGGTPTTRSGATFQTAYEASGTYSVTVTAGAQTAGCSVTVIAGTTPTPTPAVPSTLAATVTARNVSTAGPISSMVNAIGGQQVELILSVSNASAQGNLANIVALTSLPNGVTYVQGSTTVNNAPVIVDSVTTGGLAIGSLGPLQQSTVRFRVLVNGASFPVGTTQASIVTQFSADGSADQSGSVVVTVTRRAPGSSTAPTTVPTGPGDAVLVALLTSAIVTLLYVSYTHSPYYRRREAEHLSEDQGPMDFRG